MFNLPLWMSVAVYDTNSLVFWKLVNVVEHTDQCVVSPNYFHLISSFILSRRSPSCGEKEPIQIFTIILLVSLTQMQQNIIGTLFIYLFIFQKTFFSIFLLLLSSTCT